MSTDTAVTPERVDRNRRRTRAAYLKFGLAGVALLGIGAAATSAAWTDDAWFSADASAATVELEASLDGTTWFDADSVAGDPAVDIPLANLNEAANVTKTLYIRNTGSVPLTITGPTVVKSGDLFSGAGAGTLANPSVILGTLGSTTLAPNTGTSVSFQVTTPVDWSETFQGKTGLITIQFGATS
jgi:archaellum component FlaG (FlaF/FlaG flagellin family)